jgi:hypothetical protein
VVGHCSVVAPCLLIGRKPYHHELSSVKVRRVVVLQSCLQIYSESESQSRLGDP